MSALNFVAIEDGLEDDPKLLGLGKLLRVDRPHAVWYVLRLRRLILRSGDHIHGSLPKNITADDIASFLEFEGNSRRLVDALKRQGYLGYKKGRGFHYPAWKDTTTGRYVCRREEDRRWHERDRQEKRSMLRPSGDVRRESSEPSSDGLPTSERIRIASNETSGAERPPEPPPAGGGSSADERWAWLEKNAPTPQDREVCKRILTAMSPEDWALVQRAYGAAASPGASISKRNRRVLSWPTDQFLRKQAYLRFVSVGRPARTAPNRASRPEPVETFDGLEQRLQGADKFLREMLQDPEVPENKKTEARSRWRADPQNAGRLPPWEEL
jgi:hypothetical protein